MLIYLSVLHFHLFAMCVCVRFMVFITNFRLSNGDAFLMAWIVKRTCLKPRAFLFFISILLVFCVWCRSPFWQLMFVYPVIELAG